jgi:hypothetical protein
MATIERVSHLNGWELNLENTEEHVVRLERNVASLLGEADHVVAAKSIYIDSIHRLKEELTSCKKEHPELPWQGVKISHALVFLSGTNLLTGPLFVFAATPSLEAAE